MSSMKKGSTFRKKTSAASKVWEMPRRRLILAAIEFARRRIKPEGAKIQTPADLLPHVRHYADRKQEHFLCASINGANEILNIRVVSIGLIDRAPVHPRKFSPMPWRTVLRPSLWRTTIRAAGSSHQPHDIEATAQLKAAVSVLGITLLDHIIFNRTDYYSFLEAGKL